MARPINKFVPATEDQDDRELRPSRSAKKRASTALQKLGEQLAKLPPQKRDKLDLPPELVEALAMHDKITDHEGKRRQKQFIGRIMREVDAEDIARQLDILE